MSPIPTLCAVPPPTNNNENMKKIFSILAAATLAFGFTACDDVPAPYGINDQEKPDGGKDDVLLEESFASKLGSFTSVTTSGSGEWIIDFSTAKASGWDGSTTTAGTYYLVGPEVSLEEVTEAHLSYEYILQYNKGDENQQTLIIESDKYDAANTANGWAVLNQTHVNGLKTDEGKTDWETFTTADLDIPAEYIGKKIRIAFRYNTNATSGSTWEIRKVKLAKGKAEEGGDQPGGDDTGTHDEVKTLPYAETFASSLGSFKSYLASGAGEWINDFSTAKAAGWNGSETVAGAYYLVSAPINLAGVSEAHVSYEYILQYFEKDEDQQLYITDNFDAANIEAGWTLLNKTHEHDKKKEDGKPDWSTFTKADLAIPTQFLGKTVRIAFRYNADATGGSTWEVRNFAVATGKPGEGGTVTPPEDEEGEVTEGNVTTVTFAGLGLKDTGDLTTVSLKDGSVLTFSQGDGGTPPRYYDFGSCARMYAKNALNITAAKNIESVKVIYDVSGGKEYFGNETLQATANGANVTITKDTSAQSLFLAPVNAKSLDIINEHSGSTGGVQLRIKQLIITYAN